MAGKSYLIIYWGDIKTEVTEFVYNKKETDKKVNNITSANKTLFTKSTSLNSSSPFKNTMKFISNIIPTNAGNKVAKVANGISNLLGGNGFSTIKLENLSLKYLNPIFNATSQKMGYSSFSELYTKIKYGAGSSFSTAEIDDFTAQCNLSAKELIEMRESTGNRKKSVKNGIIINVITSDEEKYSSEVPMRKVESGYDLTSYVHNSNKNRSFSGYISGKTLSDVAKLESISLINEQVSAEQIKHLLVQIRDSKTTFNVQVGSEEIISNCLFTDLSFAKNNKTENGYEISFEIQPIVKDDIKIVSSNIQSGGNSATAKNASKSRKGNKVVKAKATKQQSTIKNMKKAVSKKIDDAALPQILGR